MKTIVVSGARSNVGKTTLARKLRGILPGAVYVKIGHGKRKRGMGNIFYHVGTPYHRIAEENRSAAFLIIESNRVLEEITPDCAIYLPGKDPKDSAAAAAGRADITRGERVRREKVKELAERLQVGEETVTRIIEAAEALPPHSGGRAKESEEEKI